MFGKKRIRNIIKDELWRISHLYGILIPAMIAGAVIISVCWMCFGGPCHVTMFFKVPGGGLAIAAYYVLWFLMFMVAGAEFVLICIAKRRYRCDKVLICHLCAHVCMVLWYPLFFTSFAQLLSLALISMGLILLLLEYREIRKIMFLLSLTCKIKILILMIFTYINLAFLIVN